MNEETTFARDVTIARERSVTGVFGWVMGLVALSIGFLALGSYLGRDLSRGAAIACSLVGVGMLLISSFGGDRFRRGGFAMGWLFATATLIGLGLGPVLNYYVNANSDAFTQAVAGTAGTVLAMGALGLALSKDLAPWMRPVSLITFALIGVAIVWSLLASDLPPIVSVLIYGVSALLLVIDFNYLRKHGTEDDAIWLATGIFVSIVNIFTSLLSLFGD
jgi:FtsH-binding integral membrane protein